MTDEERLELVRRHATALHEHFSSVQVIAVRHDEQDPDASRLYIYGVGSYYERQGALIDYLDAERTRERSRVIKQTELEDGDDCDE